MPFPRYMVLLILNVVETGRVKPQDRFARNSIISMDRMILSHHHVRRRRRGVAIALAAGALLAACAVGPATAADPAFPRLQSHGGQFTRLVPADRAPDNPVMALDGSVVALSRFRGHVIVLNFWATWCAACRHELPALERLSSEYGQANLAVVGISIDEEGFTTVLPYLKQHGIIDLTVLLDPQQSLGSRFLGSEASGSLPLFGLPMTYFIDQGGSVLGYISGAVEWDSIEARRFVDFLLSADRS